MYGRVMADILEGTPEFNRGHQLHTGEVPIVASDDEKHDMFQQAMTLAHDEPLQCGVENPEGCEACD